jgi:NAD(P)-dependent dehydrogenase (short-subunit alcohol dehydrogenase family)
MTQKLNKKVALLTGASRGIGRAIAVSLAKVGISTVLTGRSTADLTETARLVKESGGEGMIIPSDMTDEASLKSLVSQTIQRFRRIDILVNNAGITHSALLEETKTEDFDRCWAVNARGPFILCRECIPYLKKADTGYIINISSVVGVKGYPHQSAYTASKHALRGMSMALAEELKSQNVRVHVICPGGVNTEMVSRVRPDIKTEDLIQPGEIAELVTYLVTHKGNAVIDEIHIRRATANPWF